MATKHYKYIVIDRELEKGFIVGDIKIVGAITGRSHRTVGTWLRNTNYRDQGRFIIIKDPYFVKSRHKGGPITAGFLKHKFVKKK